VNIKSSIAAVLLVASAGAVSACQSSSKSGSPAPSAPASAPAPTSTGAAPSSPTAPGAPSSTSKGSVGGDIPDSALLAVADLAPAPSGKWSGEGGSPTVPGAQAVDPDNCDPVARPQAEDPNYPRNPAWLNTRTAMWTAPGNAQVIESVVTYSSASAAAADFAKHQGWIAGCSAHFQWSDAPQKFTVSPLSLSGVSGAYAAHVGMYGESQSASAAGSQGYDYMAVILRGNSLTFLDVAQTAIDGPKPKDPGAGALQHDVQALVAKLTAVYGPAA
jgi:hypothetical protein